MTGTVTGSVIEAKADGHHGQGQRGDNPGRITGYWFNLDEAAELLGVSERTLRRRVTSGQIVTRKMSGRRQVRLDPDELPDGWAKADGHHGQGQGGDIVSHPTNDPAAAELVRVIEEQAVEARHELRRARRQAGLGFAAAAALVVASTVGGVIAVRAIERARGAASVAEAKSDTIEALRAAEAALLADERAKADRLSDELIDARADARAAEALLHAAQVEALTNDVTTPDAWATVPPSIIKFD